jgi:hypothetical protein
MSTADLLKHIPGGSRPSVGNIVQALSDCFVDVGPSGRVEESLACVRVLDHRALCREL